MKNNKNRYQFNAMLNEEDYTIIQKLRNKYSINISKCIKTYLRQYLSQLENRAEK